MDNSKVVDQAGEPTYSCDGFGKKEFQVFNKDGSEKKNTLGHLVFERKPVSCEKPAEYKIIGLDSRVLQTLCRRCAKRESGKYKSPGHIIQRIDNTPYDLGKQVEANTDQVEMFV